MPQIKGFLGPGAVVKALQEAGFTIAPTDQLEQLANPSDNPSDKPTGSEGVPQ
jgi:hypothetical protein